MGCVSSLRVLDGQHQAIVRDLFIFRLNTVEDTIDDIVPGGHIRVCALDKLSDVDVDPYFSVRVG